MLTAIWEVSYVPEVTVDLVCAVDEEMKGMRTPGNHFSNRTGSTLGTKRISWLDVGMASKPIAIIALAAGSFP